MSVAAVPRTNDDERFFGSARYFFLSGRESGPECPPSRTDGGIVTPSAFAHLHENGRDWPFLGDQPYALAQAPPISIARSLPLRRSVWRKGSTACS
jgi:hypothetical protein